MAENSKWRSAQNGGGAQNGGTPPIHCMRPNSFVSGYCDSVRDATRLAENGRQCESFACQAESTARQRVGGELGRTFPNPPRAAGAATYSPTAARLGVLVFFWSWNRRGPVARGGAEHSPAGAAAGPQPAEHLSTSGP